MGWSSLLILRPIGRHKNSIIMKSDRKFRREQKKKRKFEKKRITKQDKLYALLIISGLFLAALFIALWLA